MSKAIAIIVAAGRGERAGGGVPKQFRQLAGKSVLDWSLQAFNQHASIGQVVIVHPKGMGAELMGLDTAGLILVEGGTSRGQSVLFGLGAVDVAPETPVLIHDAARPGLSQVMISNLLDALETANAAAPALPVSDALKDVSGDRLETVNRAVLRRVQTPQIFHYGDIQAALSDGQTGFVDDLEAMEAGGRKVALIAGDLRLHKLTFEEDFALMEKVLSGGQASVPRMGTGYDVHQFGPGEYVTLCGVKVPHTHGLVGHSDADIGWHALTDAILGAVAMGDIGDHFPPDDPQWRDADSGVFLAHAQKLALEAGYIVSNLDITLICQMPKIKPHREAMRARTAEVLGLPLDAVSVKATTTEGLGFTGRKEGMAGQASVLLMPIRKPV